METYTISDIATVLAVNPETVRRWVRTGKLQATMKAKRCGILVTEEAFKDFLVSHPKYRKKQSDRIYALDLQMTQRLIDEHVKAIAEERALIRRLQTSIEEHQKQVEMLYMGRGDNK